MLLLSLILAAMLSAFAIRITWGRGGWGRYIPIVLCLIINVWSFIVMGVNHFQLFIWPYLLITIFTVPALLCVEGRAAAQRAARSPRNWLKFAKLLGIATVAYVLATGFFPSSTTPQNLQFGWLLEMIIPFGIIYLIYKWARGSKGKKK